jgi:hypothetical protein
MPNHDFVLQDRGSVNKERMIHQMPLDDMKG